MKLLWALIIINSHGQDKLIGHYASVAACEAGWQGLHHAYPHRCVTVKQGGKRG